MVRPLALLPARPSATRPSRRRRAATAAAAVLPLALLAACGGGDAEAAATPTSAAQGGVALVVPGVPTDLTADVMLSDGMFADAARGTAALVGTDWPLPAGCGPLPLPEEATAGRGLRFGHDVDDEVVGVQQVVVLADADDAVAAVDAVVAELERCLEDGDAPAASALETVAVGAQGHGFVRAKKPGDDATGTYTVITRRGSAVTLVGTRGLATPVGETRAGVTGLAQQAWLRLCRYSEAGC